MAWKSAGYDEEEDEDDDIGYAIGLDHRGAFNALTGRRMSNHEVREVMRVRTNLKPTKKVAKKIRDLKRAERKPRLNKFYCSAVRISDAIARGENDSWTRSSLEAATQHARDIINIEGRECVAIVKIVRIVRKETPPISVEEV
jgi:hypothetical protein